MLGSPSAPTTYAYKIEMLYTKLLPYLYMVLFSPCGGMGVDRLHVQSLGDGTTGYANTWPGPVHGSINTELLC
jgi:hypothetical protein